ncbi:MAG TPA: alkaline phosphatase D family protein [Thermoleophilaceae bacterium]|nr:alkaline phosphatase D family protein [Thermoleophilaceae bacterium]
MPQQPLSRRHFVSGASALGAATIFAPQALAARGKRQPTLRGGKFRQGVLSGDPSPTAITLWTKVSGVGGSGSVELEVARDRGFKRVVARKLIPTNGSIDHVVKARVGNLKAHEQYFYRFSTRGENSPAGRFRTALPPDSRQPVRFAFFSCQDYSFGYFNAHTSLAREDIDFVVNLGDYIYGEAYYAPTNPKGGVRIDRVGEAITVADYRAKYDLYRSESALRKMHAQFPMISIWDDHEVQDNYAGGAGPTGGLTPEKRFSLARKRAGYKAYFENMPTFGVGNPKGNRIYKAARFGRNVDLVLMDQRQYRADQPCGDKQVGAPCAELNNPRPYLGDRQMSFIKNRLAKTPATWKIMANQAMIMRTVYPGGNYIGFDPWQGYPQERTELLQHIKNRKIDNVVFITGDIHTIIAGDVRLGDNDKTPVATEFVGGSITSPGLGEGGGDVVPGANPRNPKTPQAIIDLLYKSNPWVKNADPDHHGYGLVEAGSNGLKCSFRRVPGVQKRSGARLPLGPFTYRLAKGQKSIL